jgi:hypothetical protein
MDHKSELSRPNQSVADFDSSIIHTGNCYFAIACHIKLSFMIQKRDGTTKFVICSSQTWPLQYSTVGYYSNPGRKFIIYLFNWGLSSFCLYYMNMILTNNYVLYEGIIMVIVHAVEAI